MEKRSKIELEMEKTCLILIRLPFFFSMLGVAIKLVSMSTIVWSRQKKKALEWLDS